MSQATRIIDGISNQQHDYDYSQAMLYLCASLGGVLFSHPTNKTEFDFSGSNITPGIALITCTRTTSSPIPNQKFLAVFYSDANVPVLLAPNRRYYIEIDQSKINDPALIQDTGGSTSYLQGLGIGEIKVTTARPTHTNYIKLWSTDGSSNKIDERRRYSIDGNTIDWGNILRNVIVHGSIDADAIATTDFMADGLVQLPTDTMFGGSTLTQFIDDYITSDLLTQFRATNQQVIDGSTDDKFVSAMDAKNNYRRSVVAGTSRVLVDLPTDRGMTGNTMTEVKKFGVGSLYKPGTFRIGGVVRPPNSSGGMNLEIRINNVVSYTQFVFGNYDQAFSVDRVLNSSDIVTLHMACGNSGYSCSVYEFRCKYDLKLERENTITGTIVTD